MYDKSVYGKSVNDISGHDMSVYDISVCDITVCDRGGGGREFWEEGGGASLITRTPYLGYGELKIW